MQGPSLHVEKNSRLKTVKRPDGLHINVTTKVVGVDVYRSVCMSSIVIQPFRGVARNFRSTPSLRSGGSRICQGGRTMAHARSASLNGGLGAEPLAGSRGRAPGGGSEGRSPPEAESFLYIFTQKVAKS